MYGELFAAEKHSRTLPDPERETIGTPPDRQWDEDNVSRPPSRYVPVWEDATDESQLALPVEGHEGEKSVSSPRPRPPQPSLSMPTSRRTKPVIINASRPTPHNSSKPVIINASRPTPHNSSNLSPSTLPLPKQVHFAPRSTRLASSELASRPLTPQEAWSLYHFETHARACRLCTGRSLCDLGNSLSQDIQVLVCQYGGEACSTRLDSEGRRVRVEIPHGYSRAESMLGIERKREMKQSPHETDFVSAHKRESRRGSAYIEPARTRDDDKRSRHRSDLYEVKVAPASTSRYEAGEPIRLPERYKRGSLYESNMRRPRKEYIIEERTPERREQSQDREWKQKEREERRERRRERGTGPRNLRETLIAPDNAKSAQAYQLEYDIPSLPRSKEPQLEDDRIGEAYTQDKSMEGHVPSHANHLAPVSHVKDYDTDELLKVPETRRNADTHSHQSASSHRDDCKNDDGIPDRISASTGNECANEGIDHGELDITTGSRRVGGPERHMRAKESPNDLLTRSAERQLPSFRSGRSASTDNSDNNLSDHADSIFSQDFVASTAISLGDSLGTTGIVEMVGLITSSMFCGDYLQDINTAAIEDAEIGPKKYRRDVRRRIRTFGKKLRTEAQDPIERRTAVAMQTRRVSNHVAREIVTRSVHSLLEKRGIVEGQESFNEYQQSDASLKSTDEKGDMSSREPEDEARIRDFILSSNACVSFKKSLLNLAHEPYEKRLQAALDAGSLGATDTCPCSDFSAVRVVRELSWVPTRLLSISEDRSLSWTDRVKGYVERSMGESWNWSPLAGRSHRLKPDYCRLSWKSPHGSARHLDVPLHVKAAVETAINSAPAFMNHTKVCSTLARPANAVSTPGSRSNPKPASSVSFQATGVKPSMPPPGLRIPLQPVGQPTPTIPSGAQSLQSTTPACQTDNYVYLCVEAGSREFLGLDCNGVQSDTQFFAKLKSEYDEARGWFRLWFSTWCYDHCEFFQFQKTGIGLGARLKIAFPDPGDLLYKYEPRPPKELPPHGPISQDEFRLHYYYEVCPSLLSWERWHRRQISLSTVEKEALEAVPKRVLKLDMQNGKREHFYGLYAKEARSALRVALHLTLCNIPGVIFFFLWLYQWGHGSDMQGAAVPVQLSLSLTLGYLGVLYWTR